MSSSPVSEKVPFRKKLSYSMGGMGDVVLQDMIEGYLSYYCITTLHVDPVFIGIAFLVSRLWDMITDPFMGNFSDNFKSRWGRRRPFILFGGFLSCIPFTLIWLVPEGWGSFGVMAWIMACMLIYNTFYTVYYIPYNSLGAEMSNDYNERTSIGTVRVLITRIANLGLAPIFEIVYNRELFDSDREGYVTVALVLAGISILGWLWLFFGVKEKPGMQRQQEEPMRLGESFKYTFQNKSFVLLLWSQLFWGVAFWSVLRLGRYIYVFYVHNGSEQSAGRINTIGEVVAIVSSFVSILGIGWLAKRIGKLKTKLLITVIQIPIQASSWFLFDPDNPGLFIIFQALAGLIFGQFILTFSMLADVVDEDEARTGRRRQGMFFGISGLVQKISYSIGPTLSGLVLNSTGFVKEAEMQSESTLFWMRFLYAFSAIPLLALTFFVLLGYTLSEARVRELRRQLDSKSEQ